MIASIERSKDYLFSSASLGAGLGEKWHILWKQTKNIRVSLGLESHHPNEVYSVRTKYGLLHFRDNFGDITNLANIFYRKTYQIQEVQHEGVILDIGANVGLAAAWFAYHNPDKEIHCFEPLAANVEMARLNCSTAVVHETALGSDFTGVTLSVDKDNVMASNIPCAWETREIELEVRPLDEFIETHGIEKVALMKLDVEGMELDVLRGSSKALSITKQLVMETHGISRHEESKEILLEAGFVLDSEEFDGKTGMIFASRN